MISVPDSGKRIKLSIRPDCFMDEKNAEPGASLSRIENALIDMIEPLGFEREIDATIGNQNIRARLELRTTAGEGDVINLCFDMGRVHFFDPETGRNLMGDATFDKGC
jgi:multiple sugar transport system ATP-binding protein